MPEHIMVIDDSPTVRISVEFALKSLGYPILQAENGKDALEKIKVLIDGGDELLIVISDVNMPVMNGIEFIKEFKQIDKFTPVIVLTTESEDGTISEGKKAGASGWMIKPFQPAELADVIKKFIK
jgi:two-component system, chemotaxis family, chemotaxis protein CheY